MKSTSVLGITVCLAALSAFVHAQDHPANGDARPEGPRGLHQADGNNDGIVTGEEFSQFQQDIFAKSDLNKDGQLDREEVLSIGDQLRGRDGQIPPTPNPEWRSGKEDKHRRGHRNPEQIFSTFDQDDDGSLQASEVPEGMAQHFGRLDADGNGAITLQEFIDGRPDPKEMKARFEERFKTMDKNADGIIQKDEAEGRMQQHFDKLDGNGDGSIDAEELKALREKMRSRDGGDRSRHHRSRGESAPAESAQP